MGTRQSALSETTEFTVDTTADSIKATQFTVMGAANGNVKVQMAAEYLLQAEMQFEDRKVKLLPLTSTIWEANVPEELLQAESFVLSNRDLAGNAWEGSFKSELIKAQLRLIPGFNQLGVSAASQPQVLPARANLNIGIVIFLSMLTLIDFIILSKSGLTYRQSRRHLHLAVFIVVIIMTLIGGFIGKIGVGISNF
ncbi:MAG: hypothetical protein JNK26_00750 [Candidatus Doudnabacteria bacterium]|nr:hypothetical protein [Candidatus Doudnabacteria bacterium]